MIMKLTPLQRKNTSDRLSPIIKGFAAGVLLAGLATIPGHTMIHGSQQNEPNAVDELKNIEKAPEDKNPEKCATIKNVGKVLKHPSKQDILMAVLNELDKDRNPTFNICYSKDGGKTWAFKGNAYDLAVDRVEPNLVYGVGKNSVLVSEDYGESFKTVRRIDASLSMVVKADFRIAGRFYLASDNSNGGLYALSDKGNSMEFYPFYASMKTSDADKRTLQNRRVWDVSQDPASPKTFYVTSEDGAHVNYSKTPGGGFGPTNEDRYFVIRSQNGGNTWQPFSNGLNWHSLKIKGYPDKKGKTRWYADEEGWGIFALDDSGNKWRNIFRCGMIMEHITDPTDSSRHFILAPAKWPREMIIMSSDYGFTWKKLFYDPKMTMGSRDYDPNSIDMDRNGNLYIGRNDGIFIVTKSQISQAESSLNSSLPDGQVFPGVSIVGSK